jgi:hypothetical protein
MIGTSGPSSCRTALPFREEHLYGIARNAAPDLGIEASTSQFSMPFLTVL